jgi:hypothetical protein
MNVAVVQVAEISMRRAMPGVMALLLVVGGEAAAQAYHPASLDRFEQAPPRVLGLSPMFVRALHQEHEMDLQALDAFGGKPRADALRPLERPGPWTLYGRLGFANFQNQLDPDRSGVRFSWRRTGPSLGKISIGIHRRF